MNVIPVERINPKDPRWVKEGSRPSTVKTQLKLVVDIHVYELQKRRDACYRFPLEWEVRDSSIT